MEDGTTEIGKHAMPPLLRVKLPNRQAREEGKRGAVDAGKRAGNCAQGTQHAGRNRLSMNVSRSEQTKHAARIGRSRLIKTNKETQEHFCGISRPLQYVLWWQYAVSCFVGCRFMQSPRIARWLFPLSHNTMLYVVHVKYSGRRLTPAATPAMFTTVFDVARNISPKAREALPNWCPEDEQIHDCTGQTSPSASLLVAPSRLASIPHYPSVVLSLGAIIVPMLLPSFCMAWGILVAVHTTTLLPRRPHGVHCKLSAWPGLCTLSLFLRAPQTGEKRMYDGRRRRQRPVSNRRTFPHTSRKSTNATTQESAAAASRDDRIGQSFPTT
ncbi:uncharacterized protein SPSK_09580 [Sporothrix schenckii 1099-18]|uniref:Uncharacterized protein n=1 Tax=Sporothrix schenckii 1099-18 TaxID=1397361 RepID=A0A0F2M4Q9_SPOSC|nr:uncharacterized protein SPSK_09580 [Sporothrix schenckii 1099-18]KJR84607.1 hypothetical protein SPSK_09580 [Sporothrix schenckii 1099-18]